MNTSLQVSVQKSVCHSLFSWKFRSSLMPRASRSITLVSRAHGPDLPLCSRTSVPTQLCREWHVPLAKVALILLHHSWDHRVCSGGCQTAIWEQAQFGAGSDIVLISAKHPEYSQPTQMFYYCILICIIEIALEGQEQFRLHCADMNKNYSKQQIRPPGIAVKKTTWTMLRWTEEVQGGKGKQITANEINASYYQLWNHSNSR